MKNNKFKNGDVVVWDPMSINPNFLDNISEFDRLRYYGPLGYGSKKVKLFVFITSIYGNDDSGNYNSGHCVLVDLDDGHIEVMRHTCEFRKATDQEF